jgi:hypothetical protein
MDEPKLALLNRTVRDTTEPGVRDRRAQRTYVVEVPRWVPTFEPISREQPGTAQQSLNERVAFLFGYVMIVGRCEVETGKGCRSGGFHVEKSQVVCWIDLKREQHALAGLGSRHLVCFVKGTTHRRLQTYTEFL